jgi:hypothetical protein
MIHNKNKQGQGAEKDFSRISRVAAVSSVLSFPKIKEEIDIWDHT